MSSCSWTQTFKKNLILKTNLSKCSITLFFGGEESLDERDQASPGLSCAAVSDKIPRCLLSIKKLPRTHLQSLVNVERKLPPFLSALMARSGRLVWIESVLSDDIPIYAMLADGLPPWVRKEVDAICRKFLWTGKDEWMIRCATSVWWHVQSPTHRNRSRQSIWPGSLRRKNNLKHYFNWFVEKEKHCSG